MLLNLTELIRKYKLKITGVLHIGAHEGQEVPEYHRNGIKDIVLIEPCAKAFNVLKNKFNAHHHIKLFNIACGAHDGEAVMVTETANKGQSNSLLSPADHIRQYPSIVFNGTELVKLKTLDSLQFESKYNMINSDCQGYEGEVFKGASETLKNIDYIYSEVNKNNVYEGCILVDQLDKLLADFKRVETGQWVNDSWTDALYIKRSLL